MSGAECIFPSIYSSNHGYLMEECKKVENAGFHTLHVDIQDGVCSSEISFGMKLVKLLRENSRMEFDIHVMLYELESYLDRLKGLQNVRAVTFHPQSLRFPTRAAGKIHGMGYRVGLAFALHDPVEQYGFMEKMVSSVLVCTASVDGLGNLYNPWSEFYIRRVRAVFPTQDIVVDGNINAENINAVRKAGATHFVMGREIFETPDLYGKIRELEDILQI